MTRLLIGQSYYLRFDTKLWRQMQPYPPLGSLYAAAELRRRGHEVALFDAMLAASESEWDDALHQATPVSGLVTVNGPTLLMSEHASVT